MLGATTITYLTGRLVATGEKKRRKTILIVGVWLLLGMLLVMKYSGFFAENLNALFGTMNFGFRFPVRRFLLPLGISFYTLSAIGYMADVYCEACTLPEFLPDHHGRSDLYVQRYCRDACEGRGYPE